MARTNAARTNIIMFRASDPEKEALEKLAELHGVGTSEFIRDLLRKAAQQAGFLPKLTIENSTEEPALIAA